MATRDKLIEFVKKIRQLRRALTFFIVTVPPPAFYPVVLYIALGYVPIQWICIVVSFHSTPFLSVVCILMATWRVKTKLSSAPKSVPGGRDAHKKISSSSNQIMVAAPLVDGFLLNSLEKVDSSAVERVA